MNVTVKMQSIRVTLFIIFLQPARLWATQQTVSSVFLQIFDFGSYGFAILDGSGCGSS